MIIYRRVGVRRALAAVLAAFIIAGGAGAAAGVTARADEVTAMSAQNATIKGDGVRSRSGAGTSYDVVADGLSNGTAVTVTGQATDSDGNVWYQVTFADGKQGFVRNDFLELGDVIQEETTEPEAVEEQPEVPTDMDAEEISSDTTPIVSNQYVALYEEDDQGTYYWYLHNNDDGYRVKIDDLLDAARSVDDVDAIVKQNKTLKTAMIVMGVVIVILVIILILLIFRLRDYMYYEEDEEEEEVEEEPRKSSFFKRRRDEDILEDEEEPDRVKRTSRQDAGRGRGARDYAEERASRSLRQSGGERETDSAPRQQTSSRVRESEQTRRARNIMKEDDDLEYEFLNIDDK